MNAFCRAAVRQVRAWPHSLLFWWLMVLAPLAGLGTLWALLGTGMLRELPVVVCDEDKSSQSRELIRRIDAIPSIRVQDVVSDAGQGEALLRRGQIYAFIVIPRHFERDMLRRRPVQPVAFLEGRHVTSAGVLNRDLSELGIDLWREQDRDLRRRMGVPGSSAQRQASTVGLDLRPIANPVANYRPFLLPGVMTALLQLALSVMSVTVSQSLIRQHGSAPDLPGFAEAFACAAGTLLPLVLWGWLLGCGLSGLLILHGDLTLRTGFAPLVRGWLLFSLASVSLGLLACAATHTFIQGLGVVSGFSSPAFAFAGLTFPLLSMPLAGRMWAMLLPVTHMLSILVTGGQMGSSSLGTSFFSLIMLAVIEGGLGLALAAWRASHPEEERPLSSRSGTGKTDEVLP